MGGRVTATGGAGTAVIAKGGHVRTVARTLCAVVMAATVAPLRGTPPEAPLATLTVTRGWATFGQVLPRGAARGGLRVGTLPTQTDVKNRWPDGSIRFAIVTAEIPSDATYDVVAEAHVPAPFAPRVPEAVVTLQVDGDVLVARMAATSRDRWLDGGLVQEWRSVVAPATAAGAAHPFLRVCFDTRIYRDGSGRVEVVVENVLDRPDATTVVYGVTIDVAGQRVFARPQVAHFYLTRWRRAFPLGNRPPAQVTPDLVPFHRAAAVPPYLRLVQRRPQKPEGVTYEILGAGALNRNMPEHGGRAELAPYPDWTARYLAHRHPADLPLLLANADLSGSWPIHVREPERGLHVGLGPERYVSIEQRPRLWFDDRARGDDLDYIQGMPLPLREYGSVTPGPGQSPLIPDTAHQPSLAFVPYLLTGDRYYAEEMAFWANYSMLRTYPKDGVRGHQGILAGNEVRGFGWALRNMADAAAYYPDHAPMQTYLRQRVEANLAWLDRYARERQTAANPLHILWTGKRPEVDAVALWEQSYLAFAIDRAARHGFAGGVEHRDAIARLQLRLFTSDPDYPRAEAGAYVIMAGRRRPAGFEFFPRLADVWRATRGQERPFPGYYGPEARLLLMMAIENGWPGARGAYDFLWPFIGEQPFIDGIPDLASRAGWAVDFYPSARAARQAQAGSGTRPPQHNPT